MNRTITDEQREVLEDLVRKSNKTGDDWGIPTAVEDYLEDESDDRTPLQYLSAVDKDIDYNLQHGIDLDQEEEDRASAKRAHALVSDAIEKLRDLKPKRTRAAYEDKGFRPYDVRWGDTFLWFGDDMIASAEYARNDTWRVGLHRKKGSKWISVYEDVTAKTPRLALNKVWEKFGRGREIETTEAELIQAHFMPPKGMSIKEWKASMPPRIKGEYRESNPGDCGCGCQGAGTCGTKKGRKRRSRNPSTAAPTERQLAARLARGEHS